MNKSKITTHSILSSVLKSRVEAINLLKEIRLISGLSYRKHNIIDFNYINDLIDKFKDKFELEGFKK